MKERRDVPLVRLQLIEGAPDCRVLVRRVLEFHYDQRKPVDENDHVRPPSPIALVNGELVDDEELVVVHILEVDEAHLVPRDGPVLAFVFDVHAFHQHAVEGVVRFD